MDIVWNVPLTINIGGIDVFSLTHHSCSCPNIIKLEPLWQILSCIFCTLDFLPSGNTWRCNLAQNNHYNYLLTYLRVFGLWFSEVFANTTDLTGMNCTPSQFWWVTICTFQLNKSSLFSRKALRSFAGSESFANEKALLQYDEAWRKNHHAWIKFIKNQSNAW